MLAGQVVANGLWKESPQIVAFFQQTAGVILLLNSVVGVIMVEGCARRIITGCVCMPLPPLPPAPPRSPPLPLWLRACTAAAVA